MKKVFATLMALVLVMGLLASCSGGAPSSSAAEAAPADSAAPATEAAAPAESAKPGEVVELTIGSGPIGGAYLALAGGIASIVNENVEGVNMTVMASGGGVENARLCGLGEMDLGFIAIEQGYNANEGTEIFEGETLALETIGTMHATVVQVAVLADSDIKEMQDLKGKRVAIGEPGSGSEMHALQWGTKEGWKDGVDWEFVYLPYEQSMDQLNDGLIDAAVIVSGMPAAPITSLDVSRPIRLVNMNAEFQAQHDSPFQSFETVAAGTYSGMDADITTVFARMAVSARVGLDEDLVYQITEAIYTHLDELKTYHASAESISYDAAADTKLPLNPGAERWFKEVGLVA